MKQELLKAIEDLEKLGLKKQANELRKEFTKETKKEKSILETKEFDFAFKSNLNRPKENIDAAKELLDVGIDILPDEIRSQIKSTCREPRENVYVKPRNWLGVDYQKEYESRINSVKIKSHTEKLKDEIRKEIDEEIAVIMLNEPDESKARTICIENQLKKLGWPLGWPLSRIYR